MLNLFRRRILRQQMVKGVPQVTDNKQALKARLGG